MRPARLVRPLTKDEAAYPAQRDGQRGKGVADRLLP